MSSPAVSPDSARSKRPAWRDVKRWLPLAILAVVGVAASLAAYEFARSADARRVEQALAVRADWRAFDFERKIEGTVAPIRAIAAYVGANDTLQARDFERVAAAALDFDRLARYAVWAPRVRHDRRDHFEQAASRDNGVPFRILDRPPGAGVVPAAERAEYFPVLHAHRDDDAPATLGLDLLIGDSQRAVAALARDEGEPKLLPLAPARPGDAIDFMIVWPIYEGGTVPATIFARQQKLRGFIAGMFRLDTVLRWAIENTPEIVEHIQLRLQSADSALQTFGPFAEPRLVAAYYPDRAAFLPANGGAPPSFDGERLMRSFTELSVRWDLTSVFPPRYVDELRSRREWAWLATGLAITAILTFYLFHQLHLRSAAESAAADRAVRLADMSAHLEETTAGRDQIRGSLQETAATLEALVAACPLAIVSLDPAQRVITWNPGAERIFGWAAGDVIGRPYPLVPEEGREEFERYFARARQGEMQRDVLVKRRRKDGELIDVSFAGARFLDRNGAVRGIAYCLEDVTERLAVERQLRQAQKMEALGNLTGGLAHDFNNLLLVMLGNLELTRRRLDDRPEIRQFIDEALAAGQHGAELTRSLLAFARRQPLQPREVAINDLVHGMTRLLGRTLGEDIEIRLKLATGVWPVRIDAAQLESALLNLAVNARDAMADGGKLTIETANWHLDSHYARAHNEVEAGDYALIAVTDTGLGMTPDVLQRIFEPFFTTKEPGKGTGLGLSMAFGFVKQSGGHVSAYSEPGQGTTIRLYLPRHRAERGETDADVDAAPGEALPRGREAVLAVEDDLRVRRIVVRYLADLGYRVIERDSAAAALEVIQSGEPIDLLFSDVVMPGGMSGFDLAREATAARPEIRILLTSGFPESALKQGRAIGEGLQLLGKPYTQGDLARRLRALLDG